MKRLLFFTKMLIQKTIGILFWKRWLILSIMHFTRKWQFSILNAMMAYGGCFTVLTQHNSIKKKMNKSFHQLADLWIWGSSLMQIFSSNINYPQDYIVPYQDPQKENKVAPKTELSWLRWEGDAKPKNKKQRNGIWWLPKLQRKREKNR